MAKVYIEAATMSSLMRLWQGCALTSKIVILSRGPGRATKPPASFMKKPDGYDLRAGVVALQPDAMILCVISRRIELRKG